MGNYVCVAGFTFCLPLQEYLKSLNLPWLSQQIAHANFTHFSSPYFTCEVIYSIILYHSQCAHYLQAQFDPLHMQIGACYMGSCVQSVIKCTIYTVKLCQFYEINTKQNALKAIRLLNGLINKIYGLIATHDQGDRYLS